MARRHIMESTFRLNPLNPQHAKINEVIKGLNPKMYKSKKMCIRDRYLTSYLFNAVLV